MGVIGLRNDAGFLVANHVLVRRHFFHKLCSKLYLIGCEILYDTS